VNALASRVEHSTEGSVLITGFRGVGKTTVVLRTLRRIGSRKEGAQLIPVVINVSRPRPLPELLFEIIRKLYEHLEDSNVLETLDPAFAAKLKTAYDRTSRTIREITTRAHERSGGVNLGISVPGLSTGPSMSASQRLSVSDGIEAEFLAYTESDIEQDFARFVGLLRRGVPSKRTNGLTTRVFRRGRSRGEWRAQVVVVIDELDKLSETPGGTEWMRGLLMSLKNLLTVEGVHFIFVAGPDVYEAAIEDAQRGNSVYDSVFSWQDYIPCVWGAEDSLLDAVVTDPVSRSAPELERVRDHLAFRGRGVPRLLLRELNRLVDWEGNQPCLRLDSRKVAEVELYAGLQRLIRKFIEVHADRELDPVHLDQWRLGVYYAVDWILRCGLTFTADDIVALGAGDGLDSLLALSDDEVEDLLEHLESCGVLVRNSADPADDTFYGDVPEAQAPVYAVSDQLESVVRPQEAAEGLPDLAHAPVGAGRSLRGGRYELIAELDRGGSGRVYRARDSESGVEVAVKVFDLPGLRGNEFMRSRFKREARIALELDHPNIVKGRDAFTEPDGTLAFVTDLVGGASLAQRLVQEGPLSPAKSVAVAARILDALDYLNAKGIARLDLRPSSIMVDEQLAPTLTKFGLAKHVVDEKDDGVTRTGAILGTPAYAAPEQLRGESVDIRADLYSLGLILYEMVTGRRARDAASMGAAIDAALGQQIDLDSLPISIELRRVLAKALDSDPGGRFADPADMHASLDSAPEAQTD
jgi:serine/threonine-protein kinase